MRMSAATDITVWHAFYDVLRQYGMTTIFGNPGSTEQPMLKNFPADFQYILGLQEASVVGMADGYSQATRKPVAVNLHTSAGTGNGMGNIVTAFLNKTPLLIIAGQQAREMILGEPLLTSRDETTLPKPYVKWSYQPALAKEVPAALVRAITMATMPPAGPVFLSIPMDDWDTYVGDVPRPRNTSTRIAPDPEQLTRLSKLIRTCKSLALVLGQEVDKSQGWDAAVKLAELLQATVFQAPLSERAVFPERHELFQGMLPIAQLPLSTALEGFDFILVVGAEVWRYYPHVPGKPIPGDANLFQITNDPNDAAKALVGDSLLSDARLALEGLYDLLQPSPPHFTPRKRPSLMIVPTHGAEVDAMSAFEAFKAIAELRPSNALLVQESPSSAAELVKAWPAEHPESYFTFASGGLGWNAPAAMGIALAQKAYNTGRQTILVIGDGSFHYSVQSIYSAVQHNVDLIYLVPRNEEYAILKQFAILEATPGVPALDLPGLDAVATAKAYGCPAYRANTRDELKLLFKMALNMGGPTVIEFPVCKGMRSLA